MWATISFIKSRCSVAIGSLTSSTKKILPELEALSKSLRQARESRGLSREALAERLKMGVQQLEALETGNRDRLHEPVFVIAQARRIAMVLAVNLDAQIEALRRSKAFRRTSAKPIPEPEQPADPAPHLPRRRIRRTPLLLAAVVTAAAVATAATALVRNGRFSEVVPGSILPSKPESSGQPVADPLAPEPKPAPADLAVSEPPQPAPDTLSLSARGPSWLEVTTEDGQSLFHGMFRGKQSFPLGRGLRVLAGRPDLVMVRIGAAAPKPLGTVNDVDWIPFTPDRAQPSP